MSVPVPTPSLATYIRVRGMITHRKVLNLVTGDDAPEGDAMSVRYSARVTECPSGYQISLDSGIDDAMPIGRPTNDVVIEYAKIGHPCDIWYGPDNQRFLVVFTEHIRFDECEAAEPDPGVPVGPGPVLLHPIVPIPDVEGV